MDTEIIPVPDKRRKDFIWVERISELMDSKFSIGKFHFGLDPLLNFVPFAGQVISFGTSMMLVVVMYRNGVGSKVAVKMLLNILLDVFLGSIPLLGNVFDFFSKANQKNVNLLREHYFEEKHQGSAKRLLITIFVLIVLVFVTTCYAMWLIADWLFRFIGSFV